MGNSDNAQMIYIAYFIICLLIGSFLGDKRRIGVGWAAFFCVSLSLLLGIVIILGSPSKKSERAYVNKKPGSIELGMGVFIIIIGSLGLLGALMNIYKSYSPDPILSAIPALLFTSGLIGLGIYVINPPILKKDTDIENGVASNNDKP